VCILRFRDARDDGADDRRASRDATRSSSSRATIAEVRAPTVDGVRAV
jgi:hypothetical protein